MICVEISELADRQTDDSQNSTDDVENGYYL
jgi:hypothetical protein